MIVHVKVVKLVVKVVVKIVKSAAKDIVMLLVKIAKVVVILLVLVVIVPVIQAVTMVVIHVMAPAIFIVKIAKVAVRNVKLYAKEVMAVLLVNLNAQALGVVHHKATEFLQSSM